MLVCILTWEEMEVGESISSNTKDFNYHGVFKSKLNSSLRPPTLARIPGTLYAQQSYKVNDAFPSKWIYKKLIEGFYATSMVTAGSRLAVFMYRYAIFLDWVSVFFIL
uniref:DUF7477 domain-containing protein n=1 Tax=Triticum urartu TaxID=4572 RepID=A0A8R7QLC5_TRIUA